MPHFLLLSGNVGFFYRLNATMPMYEKSFQPKDKSKREKNEHPQILRFNIDARKCIALGVRASRNGDGDSPHCRSHGFASYAGTTYTAPANCDATCTIIYRCPL
jgi:hypothetical protein